ncbi:MAG: twin-arginine translocation signal domain-containing protein, partial [Bacteroidales bacterium]
MKNNISRRNFLQKSALATAGAIVASSPLMANIPFSAQQKKKKTAATDKLNIAGIGIGGRGGAVIRELSSENIVALCDVDWKYAANQFAAYPDAKKYKDFRKLFDEMG